MTYSIRYSVFAILWAVATAIAQSGGGYDLTWSTIDSGGEMFSTGNGYELGGTIGQPDAGELTGENGYALTGGFWAVACTCQLYADLSPPGGDCFVDVGDVLCSLDCFSGVPPCSNVGDISPCGGDGFCDVGDVLATLDAFGGTYACPHPCPP